MALWNVMVCTEVLSQVVVKPLYSSCLHSKYASHCSQFFRSMLKLCLYTVSGKFFNPRCTWMISVHTFIHFQSGHKFKSHYVSQNTGLDMATICISESFWCSTCGIITFPDICSLFKRPWMDDNKEYFSSLLQASFDGFQNWKLPQQQETSWYSVVLLRISLHYHLE